MFVEAVAEDLTVAVAQPRDVREVPSGERPVGIALDLSGAMREIVRLPIGTLTPEEVIAQEAAKLSLDELLGEVAAGRLCAEYDALARRQVLPAWQFEAPAPALMPAVMDALAASGSIDPHDFWETGFGEMADLTPAELLCGKLFVTRDSVSIDQIAYLAMPEIERQQIVLSMHDLLVAERRGTLS